MEILDHDSTEFRSVKEDFLQRWGSVDLPVVTHVLRTHRAPTAIRKYQTYQQKVIKMIKAEGKKFEYMLDGNERAPYYHGTALTCALGLNGRRSVCNHGDCNICNILKSRFKMKRESPRDGAPFHRFGPAFYFTETSSKADAYSAEAKGLGPGYRAIIVTNIIRGREWEAKEDMRILRRPPKGYDCVIGLEHLNFDEVALYDHRSILATYVVYYKYS